MGKKVDIRIQRLKDQYKRRIGVFGSRAAGKTTFFTVLYGLSGLDTKKNNFSVVCNHAESLRYLKNNYKYFLKETIPPRTESTDKVDIEIKYFYNKSNYMLKTVDFAGEVLYEPITQNLQKFQEEIYDFFVGCGGILIFLEPDESPTECIKRKNEVIKLINLIRKKNTGIDIPIGIVVTKWDKVNENIDKNNIDLETKKAEEYILRHKTYNEIPGICSNVTKYVKIFPLSAFGYQTAADLPPKQLNEPFNIFAPLVWSSQMRDIIWKDNVVKLLKKGVINKEMKELIGIFTENIEDKTQIDEVLTIYRSKKIQKRIIQSIFGIVILGLGGIIGYLLLLAK